jgi:hypothetical protein
MTSILVCTATTTVAAVTLIMAAASPAQAAGLTNCNDPGATTLCFEKVWSDGAQVKMTFVDLNPAPSNAPTRNFYVLAPQTGAPQGDPGLRRRRARHAHRLHPQTPIGRRGDRRECQIETQLNLKQQAGEGADRRLALCFRAAYQRVFAIALGQGGSTAPAAPEPQRRSGRYRWQVEGSMR